MVEQLTEDLKQKVGDDAAFRAGWVRRQIEALRGPGPMYDRNVPDRAASLLRDFDSWTRPPHYRLDIEIHHWVSAEKIERGIAAARAVFDAEGVDPWDASCATDELESETGTLSPEDGRRAAVWLRAQIAALDAADPDGTMRSERSRLRVVEAEPPARSVPALKVVDREA